MQYATENIIPVTLELGGKSPNIFFEDVMDKDDDYLDKALEGFAMHLKSNKTKSWVVLQQVVLKVLNCLQAVVIVRKSVKVLVYGRVLRIPLIVRVVRLKLVVYGPTATISTLHMLHSVVIRNQIMVVYCQHSLQKSHVLMRRLNNAINKNYNAVMPYLLNASGVKKKLGASYVNWLNYLPVQQFIQIRRLESGKISWRYNSMSKLRQMIWKNG
ncbi:unnamed protein product [Oppiella nova]|uniref:Uncharacterized protein n=1 Tax=Oppiella nova TaxID=334625 RepID=A0A7R9L929_9ACAR|nr:unnamed protein product [Oppiella nova]CAG2160311.1 unnamed protein product [Oppiella nova]